MMPEIERGSVRGRRLWMRYASLFILYCLQKDGLNPGYPEKSRRYDDEIEFRKFKSFLYLRKMFYSNMKYIILITSVLLLCSSCAYQKEYNQVVKQGTVEDRYNFAVKAYEKQDYKRAISLFEEILPLFRGKDGLEGVLYNVAYSYFYDKDYFMASYYFRSLARQFPNSEYTEEVTYMSAYCKTLESPDYQLDQTATKEAIEQLQLYINYYPESRRVDEASRLIAEMRQKLATKAFHVAEMYYKRGLYNAASISYNNFLREYPESSDREQAMFLMIKSRYLYAKNSFASLQRERYQKVLDAYELFLRTYSESPYREEIEEYVEIAKEHL